MALKESLANINISGENEKTTILAEIEGIIIENDYTVLDKDEKRPWGGFFRFPTSDAEKFLEEFFPDIDKSEIDKDGAYNELSPKILLVSPDQRLSWQYHHRRSEVWRFITEGYFMKSFDDVQPIEVEKAQERQLVTFSPQERHRLIGAAGLYTIVAEIWQHTDPSRQSDEEDIVRLEDDYNR